MIHLVSQRYQERKAFFLEENRVRRPSSPKREDFFRYGWLYCLLSDSDGQIICWQQVADEHACRQPFKSGMSFSLFEPIMCCEPPLSSRFGPCAFAWSD